MSICYALREYYANPPDRTVTDEQRELVARARKELLAGHKFSGECKGLAVSVDATLHNLVCASDNGPSMINKDIQYMFRIGNRAVHFNEEICTPEIKELLSQLVI